MLTTLPPPQRVMVELEAMASRPFKPILLELQPHGEDGFSPTRQSHTNGGPSLQSPDKVAG